jgi:transposase-like protein
MSTMKTCNGYAMTSRANPEAAKQLWDEAVAAHVKPSLREIARRLGVAPSTVMRWKRAGWTRQEPVENLTPDEGQNPDSERGGKALSKVNTSNLKAAIAELVGGEEELTKLLVADANDLLTQLERLNLVTMLVAEHIVQATASVIPAKDLGAFGQSVAATVLRTTTAMKLRAQAGAFLPTPDDQSVADPKVIEHDDLDPAWAAMRKLMANPPAECQRAQDH